MGFSFHGHKVRGLLLLIGAVNGGLLTSCDREMCMLLIPRPGDRQCS